MFRSDFAALSMIVVALAAARLGSTDLRAEQSDGTQEHWSAEKILAPGARPESLLAPRL